MDMKTNDLSSLGNISTGKTYRIRQSKRTLRTGESWVVAEVGKHSIWSIAIWTYSRESAEAIKSALVEGREFGPELYF